MTKGKRITVANYLDQQIAISGVSQKDIAAAIGYSNPNVITMFKQGRTKLPIPKVGPIATILGIDPVHLLRMVMNEYMPDTYAAIEKLIGKSLVTEGESKALQIIREASNGHDIKLERNDHKTKLASVVSEIVSEENPTTIRAAVKKK